MRLRLALQFRRGFRVCRSLLELHREAVIVIVSEKGEELQSIQSDLRQDMGDADGAYPDAPYEAQRSVSEEIRKRRFPDHREGTPLLRPIDRRAENREEHRRTPTAHSRRLCMTTMTRIFGRRDFIIELIHRSAD